MTMVLNKHNKQEIGKIGEALATIYLEREGYCLLARNWRHGRTEIDLIARKGDTLHFFEVKTRRSLRYGWPEEHIKASKIVRMETVAEAYLQTQEENLRGQLDILSIVLFARQRPLFFLIEDIFL